MRSEEEIREMYEAKLKRAKNEDFPPQLRQMEKVLAVMLEWVLNEKKGNKDE